MATVNRNTILLVHQDGTELIPTAPYYVMSNDTFMSGWGPATDKVNTVVLPCRSYEEAETVAKYAKSRTDQQRVRIVMNKPQLRHGVLYSVVVNRSYSAWYGSSPDVKEG
jgi:hypothetical protein